MTPCHQGKPTPRDVWLATKHYNAWVKEEGLPELADADILRRYIHRLAQTIRFARLGKRWDTKGDPHG